MEIHFFTVNQSNGNNEHVGTILARTDEELNEKLKQSCKEHFDADCELPATKIENFIHGRSELIDVNIPDDNGEPSVYEIHVQQTWIY